MPAIIRRCVCHFGHVEYKSRMFENFLFCKIGANLLEIRRHVFKKKVLKKKMKQML